MLSLLQPERITGHAYSIRADIWSLGVTFLEMAQGRFPYPYDLGPIELLQKIVYDEVSCCSIILKCK